MSTFRRFLVEKAMNASVYRAAMQRLGDDAVLGFELEVFMPSDHPFSEVVGQRERPIAMLRDFSTIGEYEATFYVRRDDDKRIDRAYRDWLSEREEAYVEANWSRYDDGDNTEGYARRMAALAFSQLRTSWVDWYDAVYSKDPMSFVRDFDLEPRYGWANEGVRHPEVYTEPEVEDDAGVDWPASAARLAKALAKALDVTVKVDDTGTPTAKHWKLVPDESIDDGRGSRDAGVGFELVSPPLVASAALPALVRAFKAIDQLGLMTNSSTGLHVNISVPSIAERLDPLKLVLFMGDLHVLRRFQRVGNMYTKPQVKVILEYLAATGRLPRGGKELMDTAKSALAMTKHVSVNVGRLLKQGYLEFRSLGGADYHKRLDEVTDVIGRWLTAIELACDPAAEREEYLKKVAKLLGQTYQAQRTDQLRDATAEDLLQRFSDGAYQQVLTSGTGERAEDAFMQVALTVGRNLIDYEPSFRQAKELRALLAAHGVSYGQLLARSRDFAASAVSRNDVAALARFGRLFRLVK